MIIIICRVSRVIGKNVTETKADDEWYSDANDANIRHYQKRLSKQKTLRDYRR